MTCPSGDLLLAFSDGALTGAEREETARHVQGCARCRAFLRGEEWIARGVQAAPPGAPAGSAHPDEILLACVAEGSLPEADRRGVLSHLAACGSCRGALVALARDLGGLETAPAPAAWVERGVALGRAGGASAKAAEARAPFGDEVSPAGLFGKVRAFLFPGGGATAWLRPIAVAAALLVAVVLLPRVLRGPGLPGGEGAYRGGGAGSPLTVAAPGDEALDRRSLAEGGTAFAWIPLPGTAAYRAVVGTESGAVLAETTTASTTWSPRVPADLLAREERVLFWVEARGGEGGLSASPVRSYRLR